ncbi:MAG: nudC [Gammaproteobacteria bacterium]|jgi:NAD+ diphosphatase|nr:nudC [Gammaproteobacteria bacterium]
MTQTFTSKIKPPVLSTAPALWFIFHGDELLLLKASNLYNIPTLLNIDALNLNIQQQHYLGTYGNTDCFAVQILQNSLTVLPDAFEFIRIRQAYLALNDEAIFLIATRAMEILFWDRRTQFCGCCGEKTQQSETERAKKCPACNNLFYPQISPAMLVLIWKNDTILLGRTSEFLPGIYSTLAGFVEPGETLEEAVIREVKEEVGINIKNLSYSSSQPWPFPSSLMLGFVAEYDSGDIKIDTSELEDAQWFSLENLPQLPSKLSLSRRMIDAYVASKKM